MSAELRRDALGVARGGESKLAQLRRMARRIIDPHVDAAATFLDGSGGVRPAAAAWLERLARDNFVRASTFVPGDPQQTMVNEGRRALALDILNSIRLDTARLEEINAQIREAEHG